MSQRPEISSILMQVENWPREDRQALAMELLRAPSATAMPATDVAKQRRPSLGDLIGIANPTGRTFTDEEVDDLRFQALEEKYKL